MRKTIAFSFIALLLFVFSAETFFRIIGFPRVAGHNRLYELIRAVQKAERDADAYRNEYRYNNLGLRGKRPIAPKAGERYRIVCIGDSWTFGLNVPEDVSYPAFLEEYLVRKGCGRSVEVINAGYPGRTVQEIRTFLEQHLATLTPDCLVFLGGENGIVPRNGSDAIDKGMFAFLCSPAGRVFARSRLVGALSALSAVITRFGRSTTREVCRLPEGERKEIDACAVLFDRLRREGMRVILLNYPAPRREKGKAYRSYEHERQDCREKYLLQRCLQRNASVEFVDLESVFMTMEDPNTLFLDLFFVHPNADGYETIAKFVGKRIIEGEPSLTCAGP